MGPRSTPEAGVDSGPPEGRKVAYSFVAQCWDEWAPARMACGTPARWRASSLGASRASGCLYIHGPCRHARASSGWSASS
eukprot:7351343-Alexandrium_andersonii.AAC.1